MTVPLWQFWATLWQNWSEATFLGRNWKLCILFSITLHILKDERSWETCLSCNPYSVVCFQIKKLIYFLLEFSAPFTVRTITKMELLPPCTLPHFFVKQLSICLFFAHAPPCEVFWCKDKGVKVGNFTLFTKSLYPHHTISRIQF